MSDYEFSAFVTVNAKSPAEAKAIADAFVSTATASSAEASVSLDDGEPICCDDDSC